MACLEINGADPREMAWAKSVCRIWRNSGSSDISANDRAAETSNTPQIGDKMPDGTVYAGISPDTNKPMYTSQADAPLTYTFNQAQKYAAKLDAHGHKDWRGPSKGELNVLFNNRAAIGGFNVTGSIPDGWYWSSFWFHPDLPHRHRPMPILDYVAPDLYEGQRFSDGLCLNLSMTGHSSLRCVRG